MIRPGDSGGEPPNPGDGASMLTMLGFMMLILLKKYFKSAPNRLVSEWRHPVWPKPIYFKVSFIFLRERNHFQKRSDGSKVSNFQTRLTLY